MNSDDSMKKDKIENNIVEKIVGRIYYCQKYDAKRIMLFTVEYSPLQDL